MTKQGAAVIIDIVGSRRQDDRAQAQRELEQAMATVNTLVRAIQPMEPTIGDESQALYPDVPSALLATLLLRLTLPAPLDCRFGIGLGDYLTVGSSNYGQVQDGSAWWSARAAIIEAKSRESQRTKTLRTWYAVGDGVTGGFEPSITNAYLLCRDQLVSEMSDRSRRILLGLVKGETQVQLAESEQISQSAISQNIRASGAHIVFASGKLLGVQIA